MTNASLPQIFQSQLPAQLQNKSRQEILQQNSAAATGTGGSSINKLSLRGGRFRLVQGGEEVFVVPDTFIEVIIVLANEGLSKAYYATQYQMGQEPEMPDCFSEDGVYPSPQAKNVQCQTCAACPQNQWGSKVNPTTGKKIKACGDSKRVAVIPPTDLDSDMYQLGIPAASMGDFGSFLRLLNAASVPVPFNALVTRVKFDVDANYPKIMFEPVRPLSTEEYAIVVERAASEEARLVAGAQHAGIAPDKVAPAPVPAPVPQPTPVPAATPAATPAAAGGWGGQAQQPAAQQQPAQQQATPAAATRKPRQPRQPAQQPPVDQQPAQQQPAQQQAAAGGWGPPPVPTPTATPAAAGGWGGQAQQPAAQQHAAAPANNDVVATVEVGGNDIDDVFGGDWPTE